MKLYEETLHSEILYQGKIVTLHRDTARLENGREALREVVEHPDGVCVLPLEADGTTYLVRQFRYPFGAVVEELPAGKLESGEDPQPAAARELSEEIGVEAGEWIFLGSLMMSPGFCTEVLHMYLARDLRHIRPHPDEDEFLSVRRLPLEELAGQVLSNACQDGKTAALTLRVKEYLRREAGGTI